MAAINSVVSSLFFAALLLLPSLLVAQERGETGISIQPAEACLQVSDIDFGTIGNYKTVTRPLQICNEGEEPVTFHDSTASGGGAYITWNSELFSISSTELAKLKKSVLKKGECVTINVVFKATQYAGDFRTVARLWANTRSCRDTSVWSVEVTYHDLWLDSNDWGEQWLVSSNGCTQNSATGYTQNVLLHHIGVEKYRFDSIKILPPDSTFVVGSSTPLLNKLQHIGGDTYSFPVEFRPRRPGPYKGTVYLYYYEYIPDLHHYQTVNFTGVGVESCLTIDTLDFPQPFPSRIGMPFTRTFEIHSTGSRPVTIDSLSLNVTGSGDFGDLQLLSPYTSFPFTLQPGESERVSLTYTPSEELTIGREIASVIASSDAAAEGCDWGCGHQGGLVRIEPKPGGVNAGSEVKDEMIQEILPAPASDHITIRYQLQQRGNVRLSLYNNRGVEVLRLVDQQDVSGDHQLTRSVRELPSGTYLLQIESGGEIERRSVQVIH